MTVRVSPLTGEGLHSVLPDLARLRIEVFRDYPYLYDGTLDYENSYLIGLTESKDSIIVAAEDNGQTIGCATGSALAGHHGEFIAPFLAKGFDPDEIFYCGESVLSPAYRGRGLGHAFFDHREQHAISRGYRHSVFCAVIRPEDHPLKPTNYRPLDAFWRKRGYRRAEGLTAVYRWKDVDQLEETDHPMQFWIRELR
jgi:GNAT superfamily N-acetyltransferase